MSEIFHKMFCFQISASILTNPASVNKSTEARDRKQLQACSAINLETLGGLSVENMTGNYDNMFSDSVLMPGGIFDLYQTLLIS